MTAYAASIFLSSASTNLYISPSSTYQVRIARIEVCANIYTNSDQSLSYTVSVYSGTTLSGGTTVTPLSMRQGAPAATATVKSAGTLSGGTGFALHQELTNNPHSDGSFNTASQLNSNYVFPFDLILSNGSILGVNVTASPIVTNMLTVVYFEELRLAWPS